MDELIASFQTLGVSADVTQLINSDMCEMAQHYISQYYNPFGEMPTFSPNPICDYGNTEELNRSILEYINSKGEGALVEKIRTLDANIQINALDISSYITYYVSLIEISR